MAKAAQNYGSYNDRIPTGHGDTGPSVGYVQGYANKGYHLDGPRYGISENWAGGLHQDQYKNWWGWKGNPDKGPQTWGMYGSMEHQSNWDPNWKSRIDPFATDQQRLADIELAHLSSVQGQLDEGLKDIKQKHADFETKQGEWEKSFHEKMNEPRYINIGDAYYKEDAVAGHIDNLRSQADFDRRQKQEAYNKDLMSLANRKTVGGVKTHRGSPSTQAQSPVSGFNRSGLRIKQTSINI